MTWNTIKAVSMTTCFEVGVNLLLLARCMQLTKSQFACSVWWTLMIRMNA
jgi:hypothetical protein